MTKPLYEQPSAANDGRFHPSSPEFYDANGIDYSAAGAVTGQPSPGISATGETNTVFPPGWDHSMFNFSPPYPLLSSGTVRDEGNVLHPQVPWDYGAQTYPALIDTIKGDMSAMAHPMFHHVPAREPTNSSYDFTRWPQPPPMGQISPSPSQSSYYTSSPASGAGAHYSRHNSCSSLPAARVAALEQTRFDARFQPVPDQAVSPDDGHRRLTPGGSQTGADSYAGQTMLQWGDPQSQTMTTNTTTDHHAGAVSPAMTPSPRDTIMAVSSQPATKSDHNPSSQRASRTNKRKEAPLAPRRETTKQKQAEAGSQSQGQQQHPQQQHSQAAGQAKGQAEAPQKAKPTVRHRNRDAANKCRAKNKKAVEDLESTERAMSSEHRELSAVVRGLRDEVLMLKHELLAHGSCDDDLIQQYLTNQARKVGYGTAAQAQQPLQQQQQKQQRHQGGHGHI